jgi:hypothetical protein
MGAWLVNRYTVLAVVRWYSFAGLTRGKHGLASPYGRLSESVAPDLVQPDLHGIMIDRTSLQRRAAFRLDCRWVPRIGGGTPPIRAHSRRTGKHGLASPYGRLSESVAPGLVQPDLHAYSKKYVTGVRTPAT